MATHKLVNGRLVEMTPAEEAAFRADQAAIPAPGPDPVTALAFMERFTPDERQAIRAKATTNAQLADFFDLLRAAQIVHLGDARVVAGMDLMVSLALITAARKAQIL